MQLTFGMWTTTTLWSAVLLLWSSGCQWNTLAQETTIRIKHALSAQQQGQPLQRDPFPRRTSAAAILTCPDEQEDDYYRRHRELRAKKVDDSGKGKEDDSYYSKGKGKGKGDSYKKGKKDKSKDDDDGKKGKKQKKQPKCLTIGELAESSEDFTTLLEALKLAGLWEAVNDPEAELTIFAPTNDAFADIQEGTVTEDTLLPVLLYHAVECKVTSSDLFGVGASPITVPTALEDNTFDVVIKGHDIFIQGDANNVDDLPQVIEADIEACNGVVHVVDQVILPVLGPTILEIILNLGENLGFSEVASFLELTGVSQEIDDPTDGPFTVFAPSNEAFEALDPYFLDYLGNNLDVVALILQDHAVPGVITAEQLVAQDPPEAIISGLGEKIQPIVVNGQVFLQATNTDPDILPMVGPVDIEASNGIVHIIDQLLLGSIPAGATAALKGFTLFTAAVEAAGLTEQFNSIASLSTVFLPTDDAFLALGDATLNAVLSDPRLLTRILETHVIPDLGLTSTAILEPVEAGQSTLVSESGVPLEAVLDGDMLFVAAGGNQGLGAQVVEVDIPAFNSVIHVIDTVLLPPSIAQVVENLGDEFSTLLGALQGTGLITSIDEPTDEVLTAFAPTNAAFAQLDSFLDYLTDNPDILFMVVQGHAFINETNTTEMVSETPAAVLRSFANSIRPLKQDDGSIDLITFNNPRDNRPTIIEPFDIVASNGILHVIDRVILPNLPPVATAAV